MHRLNASIEKLRTLITPRGGDFDNAQSLQNVTVKVEAPDPIQKGLESLTTPKLKAGPKRLLELLFKLGHDLCRVRGYAQTPNQVVFHQSNELLALALGVNRVTVWRWLADLKALGLVQARAHKSSCTLKGEQVVRNDGTVYAVSLKAGHKARLRFDDLKHSYRNLDRDRETGNTAFRAVQTVLQQSDTFRELEWYLVLLDWAVTPGKSNLNPVKEDDCCISLNTVQDVVFNLPLLGHTEACLRAGLIDQMAQTLAKGLGDNHSFKWYCKLLWQAVNEDLMGLNGLQALSAKLLRLNADKREWLALKKPGALLASRLSHG